MTPREIADKYFIASMGQDTFVEMQADIAALVKCEPLRVEIMRLIMAYMASDRTDVSKLADDILAVCAEDEKRKVQVT